MGFTTSDMLESQMTMGNAVEPFDSWYAREHRRLIATLVFVTGDVELATEGADEAFARALERWNRVGAMASPSGWAFKVAIHHVRRSFRRRTIERRLLLRGPKTATVPAPAGEIWQLVSVLSRRQREVVVLRYIADLKEAEIAKVLGISRSTVSSTLSDAHRCLGHLLDEEPETKEQHNV